MSKSHYIVKISPSLLPTEDNYIFSVGVPFKRKLTTHPREVQIFDQKRNAYFCDLRPTSYWSDGSIKWGILDILLPHLKDTIYLSCRTSKSISKQTISSGLSIKDGPQQIKVDTGSHLFIFNKTHKTIFENYPLDFSLTLKNGKKLNFCHLKERKYKILSRGTLRSEIELRGTLYLTKNKKIHIRFIFSFYYTKSMMKVDVEIHNPEASLHKNGVWDLGENSSIFFRDFSLLYTLESPSMQIKYLLEEKDVSSPHLSSNNIDDFIIYQDSSGGINWNSPNHVDHKGGLTVNFRGFYLEEIKNGEAIRKINGLRASPLISIQGNSSISFGIKDFWQNFPKLLQVNKKFVRISLFPEESNVLFELQGGEKKTHSVFIDFDDNNLGLFNEIFPPLFEINPHWIANTQTITYFTPEEKDSNKRYISYIKNIIKGPNSFFEKREKIDEYGWRNFGDIYADHEAVHHKGDKPFISHYNNQYDFLYGAIIHFLRSGDYRWFNLLDPLAKHIIDIDIYHTDKDKPAYNHGMFWHTDHYVEAKTATHRTYSRLNNTQGGGPSNEHNYTTGLMYYYFLTGNIMAKESVVELANWVIEMDVGEKSIYCIFDQGPTGLASQTVDPTYHGPGRGAGNSINALMDAYILTNHRKYLFKAEEIIRRTIHPKDNIEDLGLDEPEYRWSYLTYLQVLDKYLCLKADLEEFDWMYFYARESLIHYGNWILKYELPYKDILHKVEIPTETWPAQDIRKCYILNCVSKYVKSKDKDIFLKKAKFFFDRCIEDILSFNTAFLTRPLVILSVYGFQQSYFDNNSINNEHISINKNYDFGDPTPFIPQRYRWKNTLKNNLNTFLKEIKKLIIRKIPV